MKVQEIKLNMQIQEWAAQIKDREESGLTVREWCAEKGMKVKTYYNRVRRVREEAVSAIESHSSGQIANLADIASGRMQMKPEAPVFAAIPVPQSKGSAITVWINGHTVDIQNGAEYSLVEETLRVVSRL